MGRQIRVQVGIGLGGVDVEGEYGPGWALGNVAGEQAQAVADG